MRLVDKYGACNHRLADHNFAPFRTGGIEIGDFLFLCIDCDIAVALYVNTAHLEMYWGQVLFVF